MRYLTLFLSSVLLVSFLGSLSGSYMGSYISSPANAAEPTGKKRVTRNYPGGQDEEDLKVLPELNRPDVVIDRKTIEQNVLKNFLKKSEDESSKKTSSAPTQ